MKINLLKKTVLVSVLSSTLLACGGGVDEGFSFGVNASDPVEMDERAISFTYDEVSSPDSPDRFVTIDLLEGIRSEGVALNAQTTNVFIQDIARTILASPEGSVAGLDGINPYVPVFHSGNTFEVDRFFEIDPNGTDFTTGKSVIYTFTYWVDNGYRFPCANTDNFPINCTDEEARTPENNLNLRTITIRLNALPNAAEAFTGVDDVSVGLGGTASAFMPPTEGNAPNVSPPYADVSVFTYATGDDAIATVAPGGLVSGVGVGTTTLTVTATINGVDISHMATITVTNPPQNVSHYTLSTPAGDSVSDTSSDPIASITVPTCTNFPVTAAPVKAVATDPFGGDFSFVVDNVTAASLNGFTVNNDGSPQSGYLSASGVGVGELFLEGFDNHRVPINVVTSRACGLAAFAPNGPSDLNEEFRSYFSANGNRELFAVSTYLGNGDGNGEGNDATVAAGTLTRRVPGEGIDGGQVLQFTAPASPNRAGIFDYHNNNNAGNASSGAGARSFGALMRSGGSYEVSFWVKNNTANDVDIVNQFIPAVGPSPAVGDWVVAQMVTLPSGQETVTLSGNSDWKLIRFTAALDATTGGQRGPKWEIIFDSLEAVDVYIDDFSIVDITTP